MTNHTKELIGRIQNSASSGITEHILNILKAGLATTPFCGGIASLMSDYIPASKFIRLEQFTKKIAEDLKTMQNQVDENLLKTDEFAYVFERCFKGVTENYQKEKLDSFRGILINSAIGANISEDEKEYFLNLVSTLSVLHIRILKFMARPDQYLIENNIPQNRIVGGFSQFFPIVFPNINIEVIKSAFSDLFQYGFTNTDKSIFGTMTSGQGIQLLRGRVTPLGTSFIEFCNSPAK